LANTRRLNIPMTVRIAIPVPSSDKEYNSRALPDYVAALREAGAEAVVVELGQMSEQVASLLSGVQGVLLPGSRFDVDPERYGEERIAECGPTDSLRTAVDDLLLEDAFDHKKPVLGICHGMQTLNVWLKGSLIQHLRTQVNHSPGRSVLEAHPVRVAKGSKLAGLLPAGAGPEAQVNSSHHQAVRQPGNRLRVTAVSPVDMMIEAVELDADDHFALGVQWHPERSYRDSAVSKAIFGNFVSEASTRLQAQGKKR
jgi:putative glutamine amidotransferase